MEEAGTLQDWRKDEARIEKAGTLKAWRKDGEIMEEAGVLQDWTKDAVRLDEAGTLQERQLISSQHGREGNIWKGTCRGECTMLKNDRGGSERVCCISSSSVPADHYTQGPCFLALPLLLFPSLARGGGSYSNGGASGFFLLTTGRPQRQ